MPSNFPHEPWKSFFTEIDESLEEQVALHCLGGFVMTVLYGLDRPTADVDILPVGSNAAMESLMAGQGSKLHKKYRVYLQVVGVAQVPVNYEDRLTEMFPGTFNHLRLFALDPYDLALSKLERNTQRDRDGKAPGANSAFRSQRAARTLSEGTPTGSGQPGPRRSNL